MIKLAWHDENLYDVYSAFDVSGDKFCREYVDLLVT